MTILLVADHRFEQSADDVFALSIDAERFPPTFTGYGPIPAMRRIVLLGPVAAGSEREIHNADGTVLHERITALRAPLHHAYTLSGFRAPFAWLVRAGHADWQFQPLQRGTRVTWTYRFEPATRTARPFASLLLRRCLQPAMQRCLRNLQAALEGRPPG